MEGLVIKKILILLIVISALIIVGGCQQQESPMEDSISLSKLNDFYVGKPQTSQSLIHAYIPANSDKMPVIMLPGLGLGADIYKSTPDGRNGWVYDFVKAGYPVYTVDTSDLVSSGLSEEKANNSLKKWNSQMIWQRWGLGKGPNRPYPNGQFPTESFEQFYASIPRRVTATKSNSTRAKTSDRKKGREEAGSMGANQQEVDNLIQLLEKTGPSIIVVHSMGGTTGYEVARQRPDLVQGIVAIEPVGSPTDKEGIEEVFAKMPYLGVYGDYLEARNQTGRLKDVEKTVELINQYDGEAELIRLTEEGISGNSHLMMIDKNNHQIAKLIIDWLNKKVE